MPIYEFECTSCKRREEVLMPWTAGLAIDKPGRCVCGMHAWERVISPPTIKFKGGGWSTPKKTGDNF